ncbi:MAG: hypothetical protein OHK0022_24660 [Roseiflexaceae bacterium]
MIGFGREHPPVAPAGTNSGTQTLPQVGAATQDEIKEQFRAIRALGVSKELLRHAIGRGYEPRAILALAQRHGPEALAEQTGFRPAPANPDAALSKPNSAPPARVRSAAVALAPRVAQPARSQARAPQRQDAKLAAPPGWWDEIIADAGLYGLAVLLWMTNGLFTIIGVMALLPTGPVQMLGLPIGVLAHLLISRIEYTFWNRRRLFSIYLFPLLLSILIDVGTSHQGLLSFTERLFPQLLGGMPASTLDHVRLMLAPDAAPPDWWPRSVAVLLLALALGLGSERLMRRFRQGFVETWSLRYGSNA